MSSPAAPQRTSERVAVTRWLTHPAADQYLILGSTIMLLVLGLVMVLSASSVYAYTTAGSTFALFAKQLLWAGLGLGLFFLVARTPLSWWRRMAYPMLGLTLFALGPIMPAVCCKRSIASSRMGFSGIRGGNGTRL